MPWGHKGEWRYKSIILHFSTGLIWMVGNPPWPLYTQAKCCWCPLYEVGWPQSQSGCCGVKKNVLPLPGIEHRPCSPQPITIPAPVLNIYKSFLFARPRVPPSWPLSPTSWEMTYSVDVRCCTQWNRSVSIPHCVMLGILHYIMDLQFLSGHSSGSGRLLVVSLAADFFFFSCIIFCTWLSALRYMLHKHS
jgi:hypothetical protein